MKAGMMMKTINRQNILRTLFIILGIVVVAVLGILLLKDNAVATNYREEDFVVKKVGGGGNRE